ncbi:MAG: adenine phosphoribosyltransferase [Vulcanimicrobiota bacterium]
MNLAEHIREVPDFPKEGILFKDITTLVGHAEAFRASLDQLQDRFRDSQADAVVALEARGYLFGAPLADRLGLRFVPVRKTGKLPADTIKQDYDLEYGSNTLEIHRDALSPGERVLIIDDLIATGGSAAATVKLVEKLGAVVVGFGAIIELSFLNGRSMLGDIKVESLLTFD